MSRVRPNAASTAELVISWNTMRRIGNFGFRTSTRCQAIASPSRVFVRGDQQLPGCLQIAAQAGDDALSVGGNDIDGTEALVHVDRQRGPTLAFEVLGHLGGAGRQVPHVPHRGHDLVLRTQEALQRGGLGARLHDDEVLGPASLGRRRGGAFACGHGRVECPCLCCAEFGAGPTETPARARPSVRGRQAGASIWLAILHRVRSPATRVRPVRA